MSPLPNCRCEMTVLVALLVCLSHKAVCGGPKLVIDQDGGADDAMAVFMALIYEQHFDGPEVLALMTSHGNVPEDQAFLNTQRFLHIAERREVPIYRGCNSSLVVDQPSDEFFGRDGLSDVTGEVPPIEAQPQHAALALIELTKKYPGEITVVALGALTNIALAILLDPAFLSRVSMLYIAVGHERSSPNYNIDQDVEAYHVVAQNANPDKVTIVSYVKTLNITSEWRKTILGKIKTKKMQALNDFERVSLNSEVQIERWFLLDPIVMAIALNNDVIGELKYSKNSVSLCGETRGILVNEFTTKVNSNMKVIREINDSTCQTVLRSIFAAEIK